MTLQLSLEMFRVSLQPPCSTRELYLVKKNNKPETCDKHNFMCKVILQQPVQAGIANSSFWSGQQM